MHLDFAKFRTSSRAPTSDQPADLRSSAPLPFGSSPSMTATSPPRLAEVAQLARLKASRPAFAVFTGDLKVMSDGVNAPPALWGADAKENAGFFRRVGAILGAAAGRRRWQGGSGGKIRDLVVNRGLRINGDTVSTLRVALASIPKKRLETNSETGNQIVIFDPCKDRPAAMRPTTLAKGLRQPGTPDYKHIDGEDGTERKIDADALLDKLNVLAIHSSRQLVTVKMCPDPFAAIELCTLKRGRNGITIRIVNSDNPGLAGLQFFDVLDRAVNQKSGSGDAPD